MGCPEKCTLHPLKFWRPTWKALSKLLWSSGSFVWSWRLDPRPSQVSSNWNESEFENTPFVRLGWVVEWSAWAHHISFLTRADSAASLEVSLEVYYKIIVMLYNSSVSSVCGLLRAIADACVCRVCTGVCLCCDRCLSIREFGGVSWFPRQREMCWD